MGSNIVLTIDGGGIKGIIPLQIVRRILVQYPDFIDKIFFCAGTSTGGIQALGYACDIHPDIMMDLYLREGKRIFRKEGFWSRTLLHGLFKAKYKIEPMYSILKKAYRGKKLKDVTKDVLIPTANLRKFRPKHYKNWEDPEEYVHDVAAETAVAPVYFPNYRATLDGGLYSSNPCDSAALEVMKRYPNKKFMLLSLGTGREEKSHEGGNLGILAYFFPDPLLLEFIFECSAHKATYHNKVLLGDKFLRFNPLLEQPIGMDDYKASKKLLEIGNEVDITEILEWLKNAY